MRQSIPFAFTCCAAVLLQAAAAQSNDSPDNFSRLSNITAVKPLPNGVEVRAGAAALRVEALRDDVLRIRLTPNGQWQEDASWAVVPGRVSGTTQVIPFADAQSVGFDTKLLKVRVARASTRLIVEDMAGNIISEDAPGRPAQFNGPRDAQGGEFRLWKSMRADEHFFGLGDKTGPLDHRNQAFENWNTDAFLFQESTDPLYKTIPFFIGESGGRYYGIFLDNTWRTSFDFGKELRDAYSFGSDGGPLDYYVLYGPGPKAVVEDYGWLTGLSPLPPLWSLGYQQSRYSYAPQSQLRDVADRLRKDKIPTDVLWLDIDFQDRNRPFTTDPVGYANFPKLIADMKAMQFHVITITDLHVADAPGQGYAPYDTGLKGDRFVKNADGSTYVGESWPGKVVFPDFTQKSTREWWGTNFTDFVKMGVDGFWNDMNEPSIRNEPTKTMPLTTVHRIDGTGFAPRLASHREVHNVFGSQNARATYEGVLKLRPNERPYVMTRAAYAGGQRYSVTWTGDNTSTWNHLRMTTSMITNLGLSGYAFSGADVGAHVGSPQPDLLTKWLEIAAFQPIDRNHSAKNSNPQEVWVNGPGPEDVARRFIDVRYRLLPYSYTLAEETSRTGLPMLRPLFLEFPDVTGDKHPIDLDAKGEFMWGEDLLIAPPAFLETASKYTPTLPGPSWYDFWTGLKVAKPRPLTVIAAETTEYNAAGKKTPVMETEGQRRQAAQNVPGLKITPTIDELPVYVRGGAIIPMQALVQSTAEIPQGPLELRVYPGPDCKGSMYLDDGHTFNYQRGEYLRTAYRCTVEADGTEITIGKREGSFAPWWSQIEIVLFDANANARARLDGKAAPSTFDKITHTLHIVIPESAAGSVVRIGGN
jgi:alpha-glucosidase